MKKLTQQSDVALEEIAELMKALGDKTRLKIMQILHKGQHSVGEIVEKLDCTQANVSKHLRILYKAGLLAMQRNGNTINYFFADDHVQRICLTVCEGYAKLNNKKERARKKLPLYNFGIFLLVTILHLVP